ncbi:MAG: YraN family protein [Planctomycetota bacterium]
MERDKRKIGQEGEVIAAEALQKAGYAILERNLSLGGGELDLVARQADALVFVEVRARRGESFGPAEASITAAKARRIARAARAYLASHRLSPGEVRCDVVAVQLDVANRPLQVRIIPDAVDLSGALEGGRWRT